MRTDISLLCFVEVIDEASEHFGKRGQVTDAYTHEHPKWVVYFDDGKHLGSDRSRFHTEQLKRVWSFNKTPNEMTKAEKIELLNTIHDKVVHWDDDYGNIVFNITLQLDMEAHHVLNQVGIDDQFIELNKYEKDNGVYCLDITDIGFNTIGAKYWHPQEGFSDN